MKTFIAAIILAFALLTSPAQADTTISGVGAFSKGLGYETYGIGLQLDTNNRFGNWGWAGQAMALDHPKLTGKGERHQAIVMGRRFFGDHFIETGFQWRGYNSQFEDGTQWKKYGVAAGLGVGTSYQGIEFKIRGFFPDTTMNRTDMIAISLDVPINSWVVGATVEKWNFDIRGERLSGTQAMFKLGWRF